MNRIKIPKHIDEFVEMQNESGNSFSKAIFRIKTELHGVRFTIHYRILVIFFMIQMKINPFSVLPDLVELLEVF